MPVSPSSEATAVAWVSSISGWDGTGVATKLPVQTQWGAKDTFVTCRTVGGVPDPYTGLRAPVCSVHCWAPPGQWRKAFNLATTILEACFAGGAESRRITVSSSFYPADVRSVIPQREPMEVLADPMNLAHVTLDLLLTFTVRKS